MDDKKFLSVSCPRVLKIVQGLFERKIVSRGQIAQFRGGGGGGGGGGECSKKDTEFVQGR